MDWAIDIRGKNCARSAPRTRFAAALLYFAARYRMQELIDAIRKQCSRDVWQRAQQLSQTATVTGKRTHNEELELLVITRGGMASPLVCLSPKHVDWSCECDSQ